MKEINKLLSLASLASLAFSFREPCRHRLLLAQGAVDQARVFVGGESASGALIRSPW